MARKRLALHKALYNLGYIFLAWGDTEPAQNLFIVALEGFTHMGVHHDRARCFLSLGDIAQQQEHLEKAVELWEKAQPLFEQTAQTKDITQINTRLATVAENVSVI
jgi:tetratricopeptide (TPR) repeat protein